MNPFDSGRYAGQIPSQDQEQARRNSSAARATGASVGLQGNNDLGLRFNMSTTQPVDGKQQNARSQPTSMNFGAGGNTMGTYQFNPSVNQSSDPNMLFTGNDPVSMQQYQQSQGLFQDPESFNLNTTYNSTYPPSMDPMTAFQQSYPSAGNFQGNDMAFSLGFDASNDAQSQSLDMLFSNSTFVPLPQSSMQPTTAPEQLNTQHNWVDLSNFNLSLPGQRMNNASPVGGLPQQNSVVTLPRRSQNSDQSQPISPFMQQQPSKTSATLPNFRNPFIPSGNFPLR